MLGLLLLLLAQAPAVPDSARPDTVFYGGKLVRFHAKTDEVVLLDSAWVRYRDMTVYSDSIHYDTRIHRLNAHGDVLFTSGEQNINGRLLVYDLDSRKGMMRTAHTQVENGFFWASEVWLVREKVLNARRGYYTTCDHDPPHYSFYGPRTKLFMDDLAVVQPVVLKLGSVPVLAAPFWLVPVASKRKSGIMPFKVGNGRDQGWYAKDLAYYCVINDYADATVYCDVMTRKGIQPRLEAVYLVDPYARGSLQGSWIQEWDTRRRRYSVNATHSSRFFFGTDLNALADYQSDASYAPEYGEEQLDWLKQDVLSYAELSRSIRRIGRASCRVEHKTEFARHRSYTYLPSARLSLGSRPLPLGWNASPSLNLENLFWSYSDSAGRDTANLNDRRARAGIGLSSPQYSLRRFGELSASAGLGLSEERSYRNDTLERQLRPVSTGARLETSQKPLGIFRTFQDVSFDRTDNLADTSPGLPRYVASLSGDFSLYRIFGLRLLGADGLLHTARPGVALRYEPKVTAAGFVGRIEPLSPQTAEMDLNLANGFEAKVGPEKTKHDLGRLNFVTTYNLLDRHLSPLRADASLSPLRAYRDFSLRVDANAAFDFDSLDLTDDYSVTTALSLSRGFGRTAGVGAGESDGSDTSDVDTAPGVVGAERWRVELGLNHTYARQRNMLTGSLALTAPGWKFTLSSVGYNFVSRHLTDYSITVWKDLHCWEAVVNINRLGAQWRYDFSVQIKKLPEVKFGKSTFRAFLPE